MSFRLGFAGGPVLYVWRRLAIPKHLQSRAAETLYSSRANGSRLLFASPAPLSLRGGGKQPANLNAMQQEIVRQSRERLAPHVFIRVAIAEGAGGLHVDFGGGEAGVFLDELEAQLGLLAHQAFDQRRGFRCFVVGDLHALQNAPGRDPWWWP